METGSQSGQCLRGRPGCGRPGGVHRPVGQVQGRTDMALKKSPGGSLFPYPYKGGELFGWHLGSFGNNEDGVISRMKAEEIFFIQQNKSISLWIDFYQTRLSDRVIGEFIETLEHTHHLIIKLGLVGCSTMGRWRINRLIRKAEGLANLPVKYFNDPEDAKSWLVSEFG
jgi:hypothetical protein